MIFKSKISVLFLLIILPLFVFAQQELNICAIRVEFQPDNNSLTTGSGRFILDDSNVQPNTIDPPPHNRSYFQDQIVAVNNYFKAASKGPIEIKGTVFPQAQIQSYILSHEMGYYNPNTNEGENNQQLAQLFIDAINLADLDQSISFSSFDLFIVFHAGVGKDISLDYDETPQDIPSLYLTTDFFKRAIDPNFTGISVDNGSFTVDRGIILPETESQADLEVALTGIFSANICTHLGMYDLFSPSTQESGIGRFGIMDAGLFNLFGLSPALPSAFSRSLAGWDIPVVLDHPASDISIQKFTGKNNSGVTIYKIPLNSDEYFLIENRGDRYINIDSVYSELYNQNNTPPNYLEVLQHYIPDSIEVSDSTGVLLKINNYDWGLPGAGILIWHVDESVISANSELNQINDDRENRGVDLEEADGSQDIGYSYSITEPGYQSEQGTWLDFWFSDNPAPLYQNKFSKDTSPNSRTNKSYSNSHIILNDFSNNYSSTMTFSYERNYFEEGFPRKLITDGNNIQFSNPISARIEGIDSNAVFTSDSKGNIFSVTSEGHGLIYENRLIIAKFGSSELPKLALMDINGNLKPDRLIAVGESGQMEIYQFTDTNLDSSIDTVNTATINEKLITYPIVLDSFIYVGTENQKVSRFNSKGQVDTSFTFENNITGFVVISKDSVLISSNSTSYAPLVVDLNSDNRDDILRVLSAKQILLEISGVQKIIQLESNVAGSPAVADLDDDGFYEIVINTENQIFAFNYNGSLVLNFPIFPILGENEVMIGAPLIFDIDDDGNTDILAVSSNGQIFGYNMQAETQNGFPFSIGNRVSNTPIALDLDNDGYIELLAMNEKGDIHAWQLETSISGTNLWWTQALYDYTNNLYVTQTLQPQLPSYSELLPKNRAFNYPNPNQENFTNIRYYLKENSTVSIKIFDLAGDLVDSFIGPGQGLVDNEIRWDLNNIASGVYFCRIEAESSSQTDVQIIKIMVVK